MAETQSETKPKSKHIVQYRLDDRPNRGHYRVVGDVHGNLTSFRMVLADMRVGDKLIIDGDLCDRGPNSLGVVEAIWEQNSKDPGSVVAVRGDHEDLLIGFYEMLLKLKSNVPLEPEET